MLLPAAALAEEPRGCDKFKWPLDVERAALADAARRVASDAELQRDSAVAITVPLAPLAEAGLALPPERAPKRRDGFAGSARFAAGGQAGDYKVTLSKPGWIDVIEDGRYLKPLDYTGALDCPGVRKSVAFHLSGDTFVLQVSDVQEPTIDVVVTPR
jgi:hypothetical protein